MSQWPASHSPAPPTPAAARIASGLLKAFIGFTSLLDAVPVPRPAVRKHLLCAAAEAEVGDARAGPSCGSPPTGSWSARRGSQGRDEPARASRLRELVHEPGEQAPEAPDRRDADALVRRVRRLDL